MTVPSQAGIFGFGMQSAKGVVATEYFRHRASDINYGPVQDMRTFPLEVGGVLTPTGAYKGGVFMGGGASLMPRMEGDLGYLLKALMGSVTTTLSSGDLVAGTTMHALIDATMAAASSTGWTAPVSARHLAIYGASITGTATFTIAGTDDNGVSISDAGLTVTTAHTTSAPRMTTKKFKTVTSLTVTGAAGAGTLAVVYYKKASHDFQFASDTSSLPWVTVNKYVPGTTPLWEIGLDNKVVSARFNFPQNGIVSSRFDFLGRQPDWTTPVRSPTWNAAMEDYPSVPITCDVDGGLLLPNSYYSATELPITALSITMANNLTSPQQEMIIGSPYPDDFVPLSRAATIQATLKWADPQLYLDIMTNSVTGTGWSSTPWTSNLDVTISAPGIIPGNVSTKYSIEIKAATVMWNVAGPPNLAGGDIVMLPLIGTVLEPTSGVYLEIIVANETAVY